MTSSEQAARNVSEAQLARALRVAKLGSWEWDLKQPSLTWSDEIYRIFEFKRGIELTFECIAAIIHPLDRAKNQAFVDRLTGGEDRCELQFRLLFPDGRTKHVLQYAELQRDGSGTVVAIAGTMQDVSEIHFARAGMEHAQEVAQLGSWEYDVANETAIWSPEMFRLFERPIMLGAPTWQELRASLHPNDVPILERAVRRAARDGRFFSLEFRLITRSGDQRWAWARCEAERAPDGRVRRLVGTTQDIHERKKLEEELRRDEARLEGLLRLTQYDAVDEQALLDNALTEAIALTESKLGYIYHYDEATQRFTLNSWSRAVMQECKVIDPQVTYDLSRTGAWGEAVRQRRPFIINDFTAPNCLRKGYPEGHAPLKKFLTIPVWQAAKIVAVVGVANKEHDYTAGDERQLTLLLDAVWRILQQHRAEREIRAQRDFAETLLKSAQTIVLLLDPLGKVVTFNPYFVELSGRALDESQGKDWFEEFIPESLRGKVRDLFAMALENAATNGGIAPMLTRDGREMLIEWHNKPLKGDDGLASGLLCVGQDVTEREYARREMKLSEERFRLLFDCATEGILLTDAATQRIVLGNHSMCELLGYTADELRMLKVSELHPPEALSDIEAAFATQLSGSRAFGRAVAVKRKDGSIFNADIGAAAMVHDGQPVFIASFRDVTEHQRAETHLRLMSAILDEAPVGVVVLEARGEISYANRHASQLHGLDGDAIRRVAFRDLTAPEERDFVDCRLRQLHELVEVTFETRHLRQDGTAIPLHVRARRAEWYGKPAILCVLTDLSERVRAEEDRQRLEVQLQAAQKMEAIGILAGGVAHDFNNLMAVILSYVGFAIKDDSISAQLRDDLLEVKKAANRAATLTRQLLAFGRMQVLQPVHLSLNQAVLEVEAMVRRIVGEDVVLSLALKPELGLTLVDPAQIHQVLMNLVVNARDAMPDGGELTLETSNIEVDADFAECHVGMKPGAYVQLAVTDTGCGMDATTMARIFEPFFSTKEKGKGTGLGLSTVYGIIKQSGGSIWVHSELYQGSTFKLCLPRAFGSAHRLTLAPSPQRRTTGTETILVVEDEAALRKVAQRSLEHAGYTVLTAADGLVAIEISANYSGEIHLLLTDVVMPHLGGGALAQHLQSTRPSMAVIYMSGYADNALSQHGVLDTGTRFMSKPFTADDLLLKVREAFDPESPPLECISPVVGARPTPHSLVAAALRTRSVETVSSLRTAVAAARYDEIVEIIADIRSEAPTAADAMQELIERFDYAGLSDLLRHLPGDHHGN